MFAVDMNWESVARLAFQVGSPSGNIVTAFPLPSEKPSLKNACLTVQQLSKL